MTVIPTTFVSVDTDTVPYNIKLRKEEGAEKRCSSESGPTEVPPGQQRSVSGKPGMLALASNSSACWVSKWRRRSTFRWKARPQWVQAKGLNPVCLRLCVMRLELWLNDFPHCWHLWGFSPATDENLVLNVHRNHYSGAQKPYVWCLTST